MQHFTIAKKKDLILKEESFNNNFLAEILKEDGYKTTENNLQILKEGLTSGKYIIY